MSDCIKTGIGSRGREGGLGSVGSVGRGRGEMGRFPTPDSRFPFPSWEGLGVGSDSRLPTPDSRLPTP
ncbi:MAG: hypothetical protein F6K56_38890 [Moorea sp. SIO3G5]|nr:hypothetical protein [Moorena sp. SIO3G5]